MKKILKSRKIYKSLSPYCEVMLSKHDLYPKYGGAQNPEINEKDDLDIILWVLFLSDGVLSTIDISNKIDVNIDSINQICKTLVKKGILKEV